MLVRTCEVVVPNVLFEHVLVVDLLLTYWTVYTSALFVHLSLMELDCVLVFEALPADGALHAPTDVRVSLRDVLLHAFVPNTGLTADRALATALNVLVIGRLCSGRNLVRVKFVS